MFTSYHPKMVWLQMLAAHSKKTLLNYAWDGTLTLSP